MSASVELQGNVYVVVDDVVLKQHGDARKVVRNQATIEAVKAAVADAPKPKAQKKK